MDDELKPIKNGNPSQTTSKNNETYQSDNNKQENEKKEWIDHWFAQAIMIAIYFKLFGVLGGICGLISFYYFRKTKKPGFSILASSAISIATWAIASALINRNL